MTKIKILVIIALATILIPAKNSVAQSTTQPVIIKLNTREPGMAISPEALGLSYETKDIIPGKNGKYYFHPDNRSLINMLKTIGVNHLRLGGNSVDAPKIPIPSEENIHRFFQFAEAANLKVIYTVRLQDGDPLIAQKAAKIIHDNYKDLLESFSIGNEPYYYKDYKVYVEKWTSIRDAILEVFPNAVFSGPDQNPDVERMKEIITDFGNEEGCLVQVTQHSYPFGCSYTNYKEKDVTKLIPREGAPSREKMLNDSAYKIYKDILNGMLEATEGTSVSFRLTETNSYWFSGLKGVSDSYASALWGLDYLHWWTSHGAVGLNFHTGDTTGGDIRLPCRYAAFVTSGIGYEARPIAYGMKLFSMGSKGKTIPVEISSPDNQNIAAYAILDDNNSIYLTIINKDYKNKADQKLTIQFDTMIKGAKMKAVDLRSRNNDISVLSKDVSLGGASIKENGSWKGKWKKPGVSAIDDFALGISIPCASALLIKIKN